MNIIGISVIFLASNTWLGAIFDLSAGSLEITTLFTTTKNATAMPMIF
jgi:hypothetical protein